MKNLRRRPDLYLVCLCLGATLAVRGQTLKTDPEDWNVWVEEALRISRELEEQRLPYSRRPEDLQDCSGIFHRVLERLRDACEGFEGPQVRSARSTGTIAAWYARRGRLSVVRDALPQDDLIEPGTVLFYGGQDKRYDDMTAERVVGEIRHLGIVVSVHRNGAGEVESYRLFHGRSPGRAASVTYHGRSPSRESDPPLGNGNQQWIAAAWLCQGASCQCAR